MARIQTSRFAARKGAANLVCGKCRAEIVKGEQYRWFKVGFRSRYKNIRCMRAECSPRQSEMTASKMAGVYAAFEDAEDALAALRAGDPEDDTSNIREAVTNAAAGIEEVADEYREAGEASPTGLVFGEDLNERADEISDVASQLESFDCSEDEADFESCDLEEHLPLEDREEEGSDEIIDRGDVEQCESCREIKQTWWDAMIEEAEQALDEASSNV